MSDIKPKRPYTTLTCTPLACAVEAPLLAASVNNNSTVSSVGQAIGTDANFEFSTEEFVNSGWETGGSI